MKLRILDNSVRLRLSQSEVQQLKVDQQVTASVHFPGQQVLHYRVVHQDELEAITLAYEQHQITLAVPSAQIRAWADNDQVSIKAENALPDGEVLHILLEKDFKCLTTREHEDESDLFPHPKEGEVAC